ncbi:ABC transporter permease [Asticcacaulis sp.]|uniref:ABC transporter permease n=1 Tax=Asticcacaulis sp. TaxID=1872648 RepID=UPI002624D094|nr:ABC transporter permease [Asticcacaulis sp.]
MLWNWLLIAWRQLLRHKLYTAINVVGLAVGLSVCMIIGTLVRFETSFDGYHEKADRIVRVNRTEYMSGQAPWFGPVTGLPVGPALAERLPDVEQMVRVIQFLTSVERPDGQVFVQEVLRVDPNYPQIFDLVFLKGDPTLALSRPGDAVLTQSIARKYFGDGDAMGQVLRLKSGRTLTVTGVIADPPTNSSLRAGLLTPIATSVSDQADREFREREAQWNSSWLTTYLLLRPGVSVTALEKQIETLLPSVVPDYQPPKDAKGIYTFSLSLQRLTEIRTDPVAGEPGTPMHLIQGMLLTGMLVLLVAAINFINLTTARSGLRLREIGIRRTLGAKRAGLAMQFLMEATLLASLAGVLALPVTELILPLLSLLKIEVPADPFADRALLTGLLLLPPLVGLVAGLYPALVLSRIGVATGAKGMPAAGGGLRTALVVSQFVIAIVLAIGALFILFQTRFAATQQLGFDRENVLIIHRLPADGGATRYEALRDALARVPGVKSAVLSAWAPATGSKATMGFRLPGQAATVHLRNEPVDFGYLETMGATLLAGRLFDRAHGPDTMRLANEPHERAEANIVITRAMLAKLGAQDPAAALGQQLRGGVVGEPARQQVLTIVGVVEDFRFSSARVETEAALFVVDQSQFGTALLRLLPGDQKATLAAVEDVWRQLLPNDPLYRSFLDENIDRLYEADARHGKVIATFASLAVIIACMGLYGLAAFTAERRTKEIGIRKVLGASVADIVRLLVWQFSRPVLLANLIAWPLAWYGVSLWLEGFVSRIVLNPLIFIGVGLAALVIAWVTVAGHAARVAVEKPVRALRYE